MSRWCHAKFLLGLFSPLWDKELEGGNPKVPLPLYGTTITLDYYIYIARLKINFSFVGQKGREGIHVASVENCGLLRTHIEQSGHRLFQVSLSLEAPTMH